MKKLGKGLLVVLALFVYALGFYSLVELHKQNLYLQNELTIAKTPVVIIQNFLDFDYYQDPYLADRDPKEEIPI